MIAILFSVITIVSGFSQILYIPIEGTKIMDVTIVAFVFATLIGGYSVGVPLAVVWSLVTWFNVPIEYKQWELWEVILVREIFAIALVFSYAYARKIYHRSPYNVYRAIVVAVLAKALVGLPFDIITRGIDNGWRLRGEIALLEIALCCVFMSLLIKHLRQIHILNGVKKREKGRGKDGNKTNVSKRRSSE